MRRIWWLSDGLSTNIETPILNRNSYFKRNLAGVLYKKMEYK